MDNDSRLRENPSGYLALLNRLIDAMLVKY
jgi:hypothetical protein